MEGDMPEMTIYGKTACPHTKRALDAYPDAKFVDVLMNSADLEEMLKWSDGVRRVPVIVEDGKATVGFNRGS